MNNKQRLKLFKKKITQYHNNIYQNQNYRNLILFYQYFVQILFSENYIY